MRRSIKLIAESKYITILKPKTEKSIWNSKDCNNMMQNSGFCCEALKSKKISYIHANISQLHSLLTFTTILFMSAFAVMWSHENHITIGGYYTRYSVQFSFFCEIINATRKLPLYAYKYRFQKLMPADWICWILRIIGKKSIFFSVVFWGK